MIAQSRLFKLSSPGPVVFDEQGKYSVSGVTNASGKSVGFLSDNFKLAGGRVNFYDLDAVSHLGGKQGGPGSVFGIAYAPGTFIDRVVEAYAGPHDFLNSRIFYDSLGNIRSGIPRIAELVNYANVLPATVFVAASVVPAPALGQVQDELE